MGLTAGNLFTFGVVIAGSMVSKLGSRVLAFVLAIAVLRLSLHNVVEVLGGRHGKPFGDDPQLAREMRPGKPRPGEYGEMIPGEDWDGEFPEKPGTDRPEWQQAKPEESGSGDDTPTLEEYLKSLTCKGCGRRCSLLTPQCRKGDNFANQAKAEYYSTYGEQ